MVQVLKWDGNAKRTRLRGGNDSGMMEDVDTDGCPLMVGWRNPGFRLGEYLWKLWIVKKKKEQRGLGEWGFET